MLMNTVSSLDQSLCLVSVCEESCESSFESDITSEIERKIVRMRLGVE